MNIKTIAVTLLLTSAFLALPQDSYAGKPGSDRDPKNKVCPYAALSRCEAVLGDAYNLLQTIADNNVDPDTQDKIYFLSRNPEKDIGTLQCKISGADIKLDQGKTDEASFLLQTSLDKIWSLYGQGKLTFGALEQLEAAFNTAKDCIDNP